jgi:two-component system alkaline phosphatase synthesis response regulator PhoP
MDRGSGGETETKRILVIEDDATIRGGLKDALRSEGYEVLEAADGKEGLEKGLREDPDLIVLDLMLPRIDGYEVLQRLRRDAVLTPVLVLTARGLEEDRVRGLSLGADDYVVKPFSLAELLARIASRLRAWDRERGLSDRHLLRLSDVVVDFAARTARRGDEEIRLTPKEIELLLFLAERKGRAVSRSEILRGVWEGGVTDRVIDMAILNLRRKLEADPAEPRHLKSVRGFGYRLA